MSHEVRTLMFDGNAAHISIHSQVNGIRASSYLFEQDGSDIVASTDSTLYVGHCRNCIISLELTKLAPHLEHLTRPYADGLDCDCD